MNIQNIIDNNKKCIIMGAIETGFTEYLMHKGVNIVKFIDNDEKKWGHMLYGKKIYPVNDLNVDEKENFLIIISTKRYWDEMTAQLRQLNVRNILIAQTDIDELSSVHYQAFLEKIDIDNLKIDTLHLELSGYCNCKCIYCPFHGYINLKKNKKSFMSWKVLRKVVAQMKKIKTIHTLDVVGNGEVFLNKEWFEMITFALSELKIKRLIMYTNGMLLNEENVKKIKELNVDSIHLEISIDGKTPEENDKFRIGSVYETIKFNINKALQIIQSDKKIDMVITNCYMDDKVKNTMENDVPKFIKEDFADIVSVSKHTLGLKNYSIPGFKIKKIIWPEESLLCLDIFHRIYIDAMGKMVRCSCWNAGVEEIGDVEKDDLVSIWYNEEQLNLARAHLRNRIIEKDFCDGCPRRGMGDYYLLIKE